MSALRLAPVVLLLLAACAGWEGPTPTYAPPPPDGPTPSHYVPPPFDGSPPSHYVPPPPVDPTGATTPPPGPAGGDFRVAVASVQLHSNCPDPAEAAADEPPRAASEMAPGAAARSSRSGGAYRQACTQSTVQLAVRSEFAGQLRVEAVRVLDPTTRRVAGTTTLRAPTQWRSVDGTYQPWDARVVAGADLQISYKLGDLDLSRATELVGPTFNTYMGPFMLEIDVSIDGARRTIVSGEFAREPEHIMVT